MNKQTAGIHHISAIVGHPQENLDFYTKVLGLRLIKQTVNFDDPKTYHLYFANEQGSPGTVITFFPWPNAYNGVIGDGQVGVTTYVIPPKSMSFWEERLKSFNIAYKEVNRFNETYLQFKDVHGLNLELVEREQGQPNLWSSHGVTPETAIKGFGGAILYSSKSEATAIVLNNVMGLERIGEEGDYIRFKGTAELGQIIDLKKSSGVAGQMGVGTVHHIAWRAKDKEDHKEWKTHAAKAGMLVTAIKDRNYFDALYFREPGSILFEIATDSPGFMIDETIDELGQKLMLPPQYESHREEIVAGLIPLKMEN